MRLTSYLFVTEKPTVCEHGGCQLINDSCVCLDPEECKLPVYRKTRLEKSSNTSVFTSLEECEKARGDQLTTAIPPTESGQSFEKPAAEYEAVESLEIHWRCLPGSDVTQTRTVMSLVLICDVAVTQAVTSPILEP